MCGRYLRKKSNKKHLIEIFEVPDLDRYSYELEASYNVAPMSFQPVIRRRQESGARELALMRWGLIPSWAQNEKIAASTINARAESIQTTSAFREAIVARRCLIPADGFYEWQKTGSKQRQPFAIGLKSDATFAFAGVWERWFDPGTGARLETFSIITTSPNSLMEPIHSRMPVIIAREHYDLWLMEGKSGSFLDLLRPYPAEEMKAWRVGPEVGDVRKNHPGLLTEQAPPRLLFDMG